MKENMASEKQLKCVLKNIDRFKKKHPKEAKQLGLGKGKTDAKELEKLLIDLNPGLNDIQIGQGSLGRIGTRAEAKKFGLPNPSLPFLVKSDDELKTGHIIYFRPVIASILKGRAARGDQINVFRNVNTFSSHKVNIKDGKVNISNDIPTVKFPGGSGFQALDIPMSTYMFTNKIIVPESFTAGGKVNLEGQRATGVLEAAAKTLFPPLKSITPTKILNATVDTYNKLAKKKPDPKDQKLDEGEVHAVFKNKDGALARATFCGPGTSITKKVKKLVKKHNGDIKKAIAADNFISESDKICMLHDLRYYIDGKDSDKVRHADNKMLEKLKEAKQKGESKFNILPSELGIKAKVKLEDLGIMKKGSFADGTAKDENSPEDFELLVKVKKELEQQGYGQMKARPMREKRQSPWIKFVKDYACEHDVDYGTALKEASILWKKKGDRKKDEDAI